jgi:hypothetical protein
MISWTKPTPDLVARAIAGMRFQQQQRYFFEHLNNPEWIEPLRDAKYFSQLPTVTKEEKSITHYMWPASRYLARMAAWKPDLVAEIMNAFPETDNPFVIQDILSAAEAMPAASAAKLATRIAKCGGGTGFVGMDQAGGLALKLAQSGHQAASLIILRSLLEVVPDPRPVTVGPSGQVYRHEARTQIRGFDYGAILRSFGDELTIALRGSYVELLAKNLVKALAQEYPKFKTSPRPVEDYSYIWRPHLEHWDMREDAKQLLMFGLLQAAERMVAEGEWVTAQAILDTHPFAAFQRILLYVLAKHPDLDVELVAKKLTDPALFHSQGVRQEFDDLARIAFPLLSPEHQAAFFALLDAAPDKSIMVERGYSDEQIQTILRRWTLERLEPVQKHMSPERRKQMEALEKEFGAANKHENPTVQGGAVARGGNSPLSSAEIQELSVDELLGYLRTWSADTKWSPSSPSYQGLARELREAIAQTPEKYLSRLDEFKVLQTTYVRAALEGFREATRKGTTFAWAPLLSLADWICAQPVEIQASTDANDWDGPDRGWHPTRFAIVDMLEDAFKTNALPVELGDLAWKVIDTLSDDEDSECLAYDEKESQEKDVWSYSLNTLRPRAFRVALNYIEWLYNTRLKAEGILVDEVPQIINYLDRHLNPALDKCLSVRLAYGEKFPFLHVHAPRWASEAYRRIFPAETEFRPLRDVAWSAYLAANRAYVDLFGLLVGLYRQAIHIPDDERLQGKSHLQDRPISLLAYHLMQLYWWGTIDLSEDSVLTEFLNNVDDRALGSAIVYVGRSLSEANGPVRADVILRLQALWGYILDSEHAKSMPSVYRSFGWWFSSDYFEDGWALDHIHRSLQFSVGKYEPILNALSRLSNLAPAYPVIVFDCARLIVLAADEYIDLWPSELHTILEVAINAGDDALSLNVRSFINELGRRGRLSYRALLSSTGLSR